MHKVYKTQYQISSKSICPKFRHFMAMLMYTYTLLVKVRRNHTRT